MSIILLENVFSSLQFIFVICSRSRETLVSSVSYVILSITNEDKVIDKSEHCGPYDLKEVLQTRLVRATGAAKSRNIWVTKPSSGIGIESMRPESRGGNVWMRGTISWIRSRTRRWCFLSLSPWFFWGEGSPLISVRHPTHPSGRLAIFQIAILL